MKILIDNKEYDLEIGSKVEIIDNNTLESSKGICLKIENNKFFIKWDCNSEQSYSYDWFNNNPYLFTILD